MEKRPKVIISISAIILLITVIAVVLSWLFSAGIHSIFGFTHVDLCKSGYLVNENMEIIGEASFLAKGGAYGSSGRGLRSQKGSFDHIEVTDFPIITAADRAGAYTDECGNDISVLRVSMSGTRKNSETGSMELFLKVEYSIFIDRETSDFLMCAIEVDKDGEIQKYYFITSRNTQTIADTLNKAYTD